MFGATDAKNSVLEIQGPDAHPCHSTDRVCGRWSFSSLMGTQFPRLQNEEMGQAPIHLLSAGCLFAFLECLLCVCHIFSIPCLIPPHLSWSILSQSPRLLPSHFPWPFRALVPVSTPAHPTTMSSFTSAYLAAPSAVSFPPSCSSFSYFFDAIVPYTIIHPPSFSFGSFCKGYPFYVALERRMFLPCLFLPHSLLFVITK